MQRVLIFGATSAIAGEVARLHAQRGDRLLLVGRNPDKLAALRASLGPTDATTAAADFAQLDANQALVEQSIADLGGLDRVLIAHGVLGDQLATERSFVDAEAIFRANLLSVVALLIPLANYFERQRAGRIGVITSVAGERGRPRNYTYGAAKGALNVYLEGLRTRLYPTGVKVTTLKLGPVDTPMTRDHAKHALFGKPIEVAHDIVRAMDAGEAEAYSPPIWRAIMPIVRHTPERIFQLFPFLSGR